MSKITLETINQELSQFGWHCNSTSYKNLDTELEFTCDQGHTVYSTWRKIRSHRECPCCNQTSLKADNILRVEPKQKGIKRTLALDQATHNTGWAIFDGTKLIRYGTFVTNLPDETARCAAIKTWLLSMINNWKPDCVGIEGIQFQEQSSGQRVSVTVFQGLARLQGALMVACYDTKQDFLVCPTNTWRKHCGVKGSHRVDKKRSMQLLVKKWYDINVTDDEADAIGIGKYVSDLTNIQMFDWE